jgi:HJR/Mrr/RecB family endonuclease
LFTSPKIASSIAGAILAGVVLGATVVVVDFEALELALLLEQEVKARRKILIYNARLRETPLYMIAIYNTPLLILYQLLERKS